MTETPPNPTSRPRLLVLVECDQGIFEESMDALRQRLPDADLSYVMVADRARWVNGAAPDGRKYILPSPSWEPFSTRGRELLAQLRQDQYDHCAIVTDRIAPRTVRSRLLAARVGARRGTWVASGRRVAGPHSPLRVLLGMALLLVLRLPLMPFYLLLSLLESIPGLGGERRRLRRAAKAVCRIAFEIAILPLLVYLCLVARFVRKAFHVGLGPDPLINNVYHKLALQRRGYTAETFVNTVWHITNEFDVRGDLKIWKPLRLYALFLWAVFRYECLYIYFNGGPLGYTKILWRLEPFLLSLANVKTVVMPFGSDIGDMLRTPNLALRHAYAKDYPKHRFDRQRIIRRVDLWTDHATHVISGCDWVDYLYHWDTLMLAHFSIDIDRWKNAAPAEVVERPGLKLLHAPNHRTLKGTSHFIQAVHELRAEGEDVELVILERVPNAEVRRVMASVDVVADQLIIGWYAMFALESMSMGKPVICYLRKDLEELYVTAGLIQPGEIPIVNASPFTVKETIRRLARMKKSELAEIGRRSQEYVRKFHSLDAIGDVFDRINTTIGVAK